MSRRWWITLGLAAALLLLPGRALAQAKTAPPALDGPSPAGHSIENDLVEPAGDPSSPGAKSAAPRTGDGGFETTRVALALLGVLALILVLRAGAKRFFPGAVPHRTSAAVKVLSRCTISPRQHVLLIRIGKRLLVVGDNGSQLNALCEISEEEEVSALMGQIQEETISAAGRFEMLFGRARKGFAAGQPADDPAGESFDATHEVNDPTLAATEKELAGLSDKVRHLARQLGKG